MVDANFLYELEKRTNQVTSFVLTGQAAGDWSVGSAMGVPEARKGVTYKYMRVWTSPELKRVKEEFIKLCKLHPPKSPEDMTS